MKAPVRRRPLAKQLASWRSDHARLQGLEARVSYVGSPEPKDMPSFAGSPRPRADASLCPRELTRDHDKVEGWLREALRRGAVSELCDGVFPRYVWFQHEGVVFEGRLINREAGEYKGYPLEPGQGPHGLEELYG